MVKTPAENESRMLPFWIKQVVPQITAAKGFTIHPDTGFYTGDGYSVGIYPERERRVMQPGAHLLELTRELHLFAQVNRDLLQKPNHYIGGWQVNNQLVLDIAVVIHSQPEAERLGSMHHQRAYYAFNTADSHKVGTPIGENA